jgi:pimeloyl-ACP methyl ester carboxylesterase
VWHYWEAGSGPPLILLHGIGMSHTVWNPILPALCPTRRVIAFDIAGFGVTPPLRRGTRPTILNLVDALHESIRQAGVHDPPDIAGNSLGGAMALEAARRGIARSVVAISPIGLWRRDPPAHVRHVFRSLRFTARHYPAILKAALRRTWLRELALALPLSVGSRRMPVEDALRAVEDLGESPGFEETFDSTRAPFCGRSIIAPVTVAFGACDWILTGSARLRNRLPSHTRWIRPRGWGHVPMWADPPRVARLILEGTGQM